MGLVECLVSFVRRRGTLRKVGIHGLSDSILRAPLPDTYRLLWSGVIRLTWCSNRYRVATPRLLALSLQADSKLLHEARGSHLQSYRYGVPLLIRRAACRGVLWTVARRHIR